MAILIVGASQQYTTIAAAVAAAADGDTINVMAGDYVDDIPATLGVNLTLTGVGGMVHMSATTPIANGKALLVAGGGNANITITISQFEFSNATVDDENGAGIRYQTGTLLLNNCYFHDNQDGILGGAGTGTVTMTNCEFYKNGAGDGFSHNIYLAVDQLNLVNVYSHAANVGHELKSNAANTTILNSRFQDETGTASYCLDFQKGGNVSIKNSVIQKGVNAENHLAMISYGEGGTTQVQANSALAISDCTFINDQSQLHSGVYNYTAASVNLNDNAQWKVAPMLLGAGIVTGTTALTTEPALDTTHPFMINPTKAMLVAQITAIQSMVTAIQAKMDALKADIQQL